MDGQILSRIALARIEYLLHKYLCPWSFSEFDHKVGYFNFDITWQRYLQKCTIETINPCSKLYLIQSARDDYIIFDDKYECWLLNYKLRVKPFISFVDGRWPCIMKCHEHVKKLRNLWFIHVYILITYFLHLDYINYTILWWIVDHWNLESFQMFKYTSDAWATWNI